VIRFLTKVRNEVGTLIKLIRDPPLHIAPYHDLIQERKTETQLNAIMSQPSIQHVEQQTIAVGESGAVGCALLLPSQLLRLATTGNNNASGVMDSVRNQRFEPSILTE
jgi:hypothetical protein